MPTADEPEPLLELPDPTAKGVRDAGTGTDPVEESAAVEEPVAAVLVDTGLAHLDREFEYSVPAELADAARPGVRVKVRFAGRDLPGFVIQRQESATHGGRLAPIRSVVSVEPVLTPEILQLARQVAAEQAGTVMDVLRLAIPPRHARAEKALPSSPPDQPGVQEATRAPESDPCSALGRYRAGAAWWRRVHAGQSPRAAWLAAPCLPPEQDWPQALAEAALAAEGAGRGAVIVLPDARDVDRVDERLTEVLGPGRHVRLTADQGPQARYTAWLKVLRGHVRVVVGTRAAAYAPVRDLGLVAWWDDGDDLHAEPRAPYPHTRLVLTARADQAGAALLVGGLTMSAETAREVGEGRLHVIGGTPQRRAAPRVLVAGEGLEEEREGNAAHARIPPSAYRAAREALAHGPVLIQVPRRGYLPAMSCATCRAPARCERCQGPLALDGPSQDPRCRWCGHAAGQFTCPHCAGTRLRAGVIGARRTAEEIGRAFPGVAVITSGGDRVHARVPREPAVVVATPGAEPVADGGYAAVLLLDAWALLDRPDLRAAEEAVRRWFGAAALSLPWSAGGVVVLAGAPAQVTLPPVEALVRWDPQWFAGRELAERAELGLPPTSWSAQVRTLRTRVAGITSAVSGSGGEVLGPLPVPGDDAAVLLVVRGPWEQAGALAGALREVRARESAHKEAVLTSVRVGAVDGA